VTKEFYKLIMEKNWALILGGSSGLGLATAKKLAQNGYNICIIHRDSRVDLVHIENDFQEITLSGAELKSFNVDALKSEKREAVLQELKTLFSPDEKVKVLVHSIAKGNLKPLNDLNLQDLQITLNAMALSLFDWSKALVTASLFHKDARIVSFTSEGSEKAWPGYAAVSLAKASLEALTRSIALEYASVGIKANCIQAGVTETKSFKMIPGHEKLRENAILKSPNGRLTTPEDVANAAYLLTTDEAKWITGTVIKVDGGESLR
jgi:NAD(P)-dependent dehydrogenase (short-subunit alcohol dehydrogenase family)